MSQPRYDLREIYLVLALGAAAGICIGALLVLEGIF